MPTFEELVDLHLRDHEGYTGDGQGSVGALPGGDVSTARKPIIKRDLRELLNLLFGQIGDITDDIYAAMSSIEIGPNGLIFKDRTATAATLASSLDDGTTFIMGGDMYRRDDAATGSGSATDDLGVSGIVPAGGDVRPSHFGALADGLADDASAVSRWLTYLRDVPSATGQVSGYVRLASSVVLTMTGEQHIAISGVTQNQNGFLVDNSTGGISFQGTGRNHSVHLSNLHFMPGLENSGYPFQVTGIEGGLNNNRSLLVENVFIGPITESDTRNFGNGISATGLYRVRMDNVIAIQSITATGKWAHVVNLDGTYKPELSACYFNVNSGGATYGVKNSGSAMEGFISYFSTVSGADMGYWLEKEGREPGFEIVGGHVNSKSRNFHFDGVKYGTVRGVRCYTQGTNANKVHFNVINAESCIFEGNQFNDNDAPCNRVYTMVPKSGGVIRNIRINDLGYYGQSSNAAIFVGGNCEIIRISIPDRLPAAGGINYPQGLYEINPAAVDVKVFDDLGAIDISADSASGPSHRMFRDSPSPEADDRVGRYIMSGRNNVGEEIFYSQIACRISSALDGAENGQLDLSIMADGITVAAARLLPPNANDTSFALLAFRDGSGGTIVQRVKRGAANSGPGGTGRALYVDN